MPDIQFLCKPELEGAIPPPVPASKSTPEWYRKLSAHLPVGPDQFSAETIKACMPVMDAFSAGYIIPLAAPVRLVVSGEEISSTWRESSELKMVEWHSPSQVGGSDWEGPFLKWINFWQIKTPPGYSCLITAPLNRPEAHFQALTGVVDTDRYENVTNFPSVWTGPRDDFDVTFPAGTPLVQVIPFKRESWKSSSRSLSEKETLSQSRVKNLVQAQVNGYRDKFRTKKSWR